VFFVGAVLGLLEAIAFAVDGCEFGPVQEAIDESDDAGGVGEGVLPLDEGLVGGEDDRAVFVTMGDDLEEEVGVAGVVGEIADLVDLCGAPHQSTSSAGTSLAGWSLTRKARPWRES
jgi:hypothetical protein